MRNPLKKLFRYVGGVLVLAVIILTAAIFPRQAHLQAAAQTVLPVNLSVKKIYNIPSLVPSTGITNIQQTTDFFPKLDDSGNIIGYYSMNGGKLVELSFPSAPAFNDVSNVDSAPSLQLVGESTGTLSDIPSVGDDEYVQLTKSQIAYFLGMNEADLPLDWQTAVFGAGRTTYRSLMRTNGRDYFVKLFFPKIAKEIRFQVLVEPWTISPDDTTTRDPAESVNLELQQLMNGFTQIPPALFDAWGLNTKLGLPAGSGVTLPVFTSGGYETLGSPQGPSFGLWAPFKAGSTEQAAIGQQIRDFLGGPDALLLVPQSSDRVADVFMEYKAQTDPIQRNPFYEYGDASISGASPQLLIWQSADGETGFWQAEDITGTTYIPGKGQLFVVNEGRGIKDYRAQGNDGSGIRFTIAQTDVFYQEGTVRRGNADLDAPNNNYKIDGVSAPTIYFFPEAEMEKLAKGEIQASQAQYSYWELPAMGLPFGHTSSLHDNTQVGSIYYDAPNQELDVVMMLKSDTVSKGKRSFLVVYNVADSSGAQLAAPAATKKLVDFPLNAANNTYTFDVQDLFPQIDTTTTTFDYYSVDADSGRISLAMADNRYLTVTEDQALTKPKNIAIYLTANNAAGNETIRLRGLTCDPSITVYTQTCDPNAPAPTATPIPQAPPTITLNSNTVPVDGAYPVRIGRTLDIEVTASDTDSTSITLDTTNLSDFIGALFAVLTP